MVDIFQSLRLGFQSGGVFVEVFPWFDVLDDARCINPVFNGESKESRQKLLLFVSIQMQV